MAYIYCQYLKDEKCEQGKQCGECHIRNPLYTDGDQKQLYRRSLDECRKETDDELWWTMFVSGHNMHHNDDADSIMYKATLTVMIMRKSCWKHLIRSDWIEIIDYMKRMGIKPTKAAMRKYRRIKRWDHS